MRYYLSMVGETVELSGGKLQCAVFSDVEVDLRVG